MSLRQHLLCASALGLGSLLLIASPSLAGPDTSKNDQSLAAETAASAQQGASDEAQKELAKTLANETAATLLEAIVGEDAWSALDSIALVDPSILHGEGDDENQDAAMPEAVLKPVALPFPGVFGMPIDVAATPKLVETEAVSAQPAAQPNDEHFRRALAEVRAEIQAADVQGSTGERGTEDATAGDGTALTNRFGSLVASPSGEEIWPQDEEAALAYTAGEPADTVTFAADDTALTDLTSLVSAGDFASFISMLQGAMVDITPLGQADQASEVAANTDLGNFNGLFVDPDGTIMTVLADGNTDRAFRAVTSDGDVFEARVVGFDPRTDLALLKVDSAWAFNAVTLNDKAQTIVAALRASTEISDTDISDEGTTAAPEEGARRSSTVAVAGAPSASDEAKGYLGVSVQPVSVEIAEEMGEETPKGVLISTVRADTAAAEADLRPGDVILRVNGETIGGTDDAVRTIGSLPVGGKARLVVWRDGDPVQVTAVMGTKSEAPVSYPEPEVLEGDFSGVAIDQWGLTVGAGLEPGVEILNIADDGEAARKGIKVGDVILRVADKTMTEAADVEAIVAEAMQAARPAVLVLVRGPEEGSEERFIALKLQGEN